MSAKHRNNGFTLIEVLIVVVIMAVLAATVIPQFADSTNDAKISTLKFNLHTLRAQIELYKAQHGSYPDDLAVKLTSKTNSSGVVGTSAEHKYGPYIVGQLPLNPMDDKNTVTNQSSATFTVTAAGGWLYNPSNGKVAANNATYINE